MNRNERSAIDRFERLTSTSDATSRLEQLEALAASTDQYSPELLAVIQHERIKRTIQLSNNLRQCLQIGHDQDRPTVHTRPIKPPLVMLAQDYQQLDRAIAAPVAALHIGPVVDPRHVESLPIPPLFSLRQAATVERPWQLPQQQHPIDIPRMISVPEQDSRPHHQYPRVIYFAEANRQSVLDPARKRLLVLDNSTMDSDAARTQPEDSSTTSNRPLGPDSQDEKPTSPTKQPSMPISTTAVTASAESPMSVYLRSAKRRRRYRAETFPKKLLRIIETAKKENQQHLISFTSDGTAIRIPSPKELTDVVIPRYFRHRKFASFLRQLSMYGFLKVSNGENKGAYAHPLFLDGRPELIEQMKRVTELELPASADISTGGDSSERNET